MTKHNNHLIKKIYYILSYAFTTLQQEEYENIAAEEFENLHNLFAAILAKGIGRQLKQELYRDYQSRADNLSTLRGKIYMVGTAQNHMAKKSLLKCEYHYTLPLDKFHFISVTNSITITTSGEFDEENTVRFRHAPGSDKNVPTGAGTEKQNWLECQSLRYRPASADA